MTKPGIKILYHPSVVKNDISKLDGASRDKVEQVIKAKLATSPEVYGTPLRGTLKQYWKLRVGPYRIVYQINNQGVFILVIAHRKDVYNISKRRD